ncbi:glycosyltransferase [Candidatus Poribacteria bacterium]
MRNSAAKNESQDPANLPFVSVLVAARNEERDIASCLESLVRQEYPTDRYEVIAVNDRSTDETRTIISEYQKKYKTVKCVNIISNSSGLTGKQNALNEGLRLCAGEIILNTDADCIAEPLWIRRTVSHFTSQVGLTLGFSTTYKADGSRSLFADLQTLDMLLLMDSAAGAIGINVPTSGLGRNLAYRKAILNDIDYLRMGYTITEDAALIRAIAKDTNWRINVVYDREASVSTIAEEGLRQFLSQRLRWFVGGQCTRAWPQIPLHIIFAFHLSLAIFFPLMFFMRPFVVTTLSAILVKAILDFSRCWRVCKEFRRIDLMKLFIPYEIFLISYSIIIGIGSTFIRKVRWKGEVCTRNARHVSSSKPSKLSKSSLDLGGLDDPNRGTGG